MKLIKFIDPEGRDVWIIGQWITKVQAPIPGHYDARAQALVWTGANVQAVRETPEEVVRILENQE